MDVVYVVGPGNANPELRFSLRTLVNVPHDRVWIFGFCPSWVDGVRAVHVDQRAKAGEKWRQSTANLRTACLHPDVSDPFVLFNDDFFVMEPVTEVMPLHRGPADQVLRTAAGLYRKGGVRTRDRLVELGYDAPVSYELHVPMVVGKAGMLDALDAGAGIHPLHKRTMFGNLAAVGGEQVDDVKVFSAGQGWRQDLPFLSTTPGSFAGRVGQHIRDSFPFPSPYEVPTQ